MRAFWKMTWIEFKLFLREPAAVFFTLAFPLVLLFVFGSIFGNTPAPELDGRGNVDVSVPGYIGMIIGTTGLLGLPITVATYRSQGVLRRLRATPVRTWTLLGAQVIVNLVAVLAGVLLLVVAARLVYDLALPAAPLAVLLAIGAVGLSFFAFGFVLAGLLPTPRVAQPVAMAIFFPMLFLSGAAIPRPIMPETMQRFAEVLPLTQVVILIEDLWFGDGWNVIALAVLGAVLVLGVAVSSRTFRWE